MKIIIILLAVSSFYLNVTFSQDGYRININKLNIPIDNSGIIAHVDIPPDGWGGRFEEALFVFSGGFFISGFNADTLWACGQATSSLVVNFFPGNVGSNQFDPRYKVYVVKKSDPEFGSSWQEWAFAVDIGAEFYDGNNDGIYTPVDLNGNGEWDINEDRPDIIGDLTTWCVFNDGQPSARRLRFAGVHPQGIEIQQTVFAYNLGKMYLQNAIFIRYKIFNAGNNNPVLDSVYFSVWADGDIGDNFNSDLVGTDTLVSSIYTYKNVPDADSGYGANPPAFFKSFLQGPHTYIPGVTFIDNNFNGTYEDSIDTPLDSATNFMGSISRNTMDTGIY
ncbi:MAG: hypothetical protein IH950_04065 [Bacteroidetes bacterium]|nr:hypothetical protein [Bacteroidota bacterium]